MVGPTTSATAQIVLAVRRDTYVKVGPNVSGGAYWASLGLIGLVLFQDLYEMANRRLARMHRD